MGRPVTLVSRNAVYHTGRRAYRRRKMLRTVLLWGSSRRYGSRRLLSRCACARKNGENAPTQYQRTSISGCGFPKKPPTSAAFCDSCQYDGQQKRETEKMGKDISNNKQETLTSGKGHARDTV